MIGRFPKRFGLYFCGFGSGIIFYKYYSLIGTVVYCEGISMEPTVCDGDYLLVERISIRTGRIKTGDVVVAGHTSKSCKTSHILKRVKGFGQGEVTFWDDVRWQMVTRPIPRNHVWLEGDNKSHSLDSRTYGSIPVSRLEYKVLLRLWPLKHFGPLNSLHTTPVTDDLPHSNEGNQLINPNISAKMEGFADSK